MAEVFVVPVLDQGLGNQAYLVDLGDGRALAVDPSLDLRALDAAADRAGMWVAVAAETHLHADFVSGATRLARRDGARVVGSAAGARRFEHLGVADGDTLDLGGLILRAWGTPGHTDEHVAYLLEDGGEPVAVFTGGSLIVGAAARTDLGVPGADGAVGAGAVPVVAPVGCVAGWHPGVSDSRCGVVLLGPAGG